MGLHDAEKLEEWLRKGDRQYVRGAMYNIMHQAASTRTMATKEAKRALAAKILRLPSASAGSVVRTRQTRKMSPQTSCSASAAEAKTQKTATAKRQYTRDWMKYLEPHEREIV